MNYTTTATRAEQHFYLIGIASSSAEVRKLVAQIPEVTGDADERAELEAAANRRYCEFNALAVGEQKARWN